MLSDPSVSIRVDNLSKLYRLRANQGSLQDAFAYRINKVLQRAHRNQGNQELWALNGVSFEVRKGEALGIVGPNGAGKTTILKILSRVTKPTGGDVKVHGQLGALLELGAGFHPDLTGRENVYLYGSILGIKRRDIASKFDQIVDFSGLEKFIDTPVKRYSSGMYVRLGFAVAAHTEPDVLLVDEVLAVGDAQFRQKCIQRINDLQQEGVSIIFISHNLVQMQAVCERGIFLLSGEVQINGTITEAIREYEKWLHQNPASNKSVEKFDFVPGQGGEDLRVLGIELRDMDGGPKDQYDYNEGVEVRIHYHASCPFLAVNFVLRIKRMDGLVCSMLRSSDFGYGLGEINRRGYISIRIAKLQLASGMYFLEARLRDSSDAVTLAVGASPSFQVAGPGLANNNGNGVYIPDILEVSSVSNNLHLAGSTNL
jgi:lipopolysaccharide transport system ATP-binding protein